MEEDIHQIIDQNSKTIASSENSVLEREKWEIERSFREREVSIKEREQQYKETELIESRWRNPLVIAIFAATIAAIGNLFVAYTNGTAQATIEKEKSEHTRILEMIKTGDTEKAAENLQFLLEAGLINNPSIRLDITQYLRDRKQGEGPSLPTLSQSYARSVAEVKTSLSPAKISSELIAIKTENKKLYWNSDNSKILVLLWMPQNYYESYIKNANTTSPSEKHVLWVTAVPQVREFCQTFMSSRPYVNKADLDLRLKQYLGRNPQWSYDLFIELWVSPDDLFRPCVDPEIDDNTCNWEFNEISPIVNKIADYPAFYKNLYYVNNRSTIGVPWTGLGYAFDWSDLHSNVGASDFIIAPNSKYEIERVVSTEEYCKVNH